ncbi:hypothetical protein [Ekhidna sp.]|uniref:hypothetical protein n=1 Tax=Ekhidna sp. TaxID=2608089 RepID=UPI003B5A52AF
MRLGQLARKYDIPVQEIINYLKEETGEKFHANAKLYDAIETQLFKHFDLYPDDPVLEEEQTETINEPAQPLPPEPREETPADDIASVEGELAEPEEIAPSEVRDKEPEDKSPKLREDEVIQTDRLIEMLESEESPTDLEKFKLIKAPKKELPGLKVLGKVDLPEPKKKSESEEKDKKSHQPLKKQLPQLSEEEKEKRRLKAKRKKEAYEARQEKRRKEQEAQRLKELKAKHYKQKLKKQETQKNKPKAKVEPQHEESQHIQKKLKEPKTLLGKWWRWMNT